MVTKKKLSDCHFFLTMLQLYLFGKSFAILLHRLNFLYQRMFWCQVKLELALLVQRKRFLKVVQLFVCLGFSFRSRIFHLYGDVTFASEGLQILTFARHSWPLSSEGSLACHTYCDTGHPFIMVISEDP